MSLTEGIKKCFNQYNKSLPLVQHDIDECYKAKSEGKTPDPLAIMLLNVNKNNLSNNYKNIVNRNNTSAPALAATIVFFKEIGCDVNDAEFIKKLTEDAVSSEVVDCMHSIYSGSLDYEELTHNRTEYLRNAFLIARRLGEWWEEVLITGSEPFTGELYDKYFNKNGAIINHNGSLMETDFIAQYKIIDYKGLV